MPKKESAKDKAAAKADAAEEARQKAAEDAEWAQGAASGGKKADAEAKRLEALARKAERDALEQEEVEEASAKAKVAPKKMTQAQIQANFFVAPKKKGKKKPEAELEENVNHKMRDQAMALAEQGIDSAHARGVDDATQLLSNLTTGGPEADAHPERRRKAAFKAYEEREIPVVRAENPGLKLSQVKEIIFKAWQKSPENPVNMAAMAE
mmetsp:Transcript_31059/g.60684  ORF Transcript_31059/g.60684 Transcript_31059/m.60684 type:complete len:209 (+) Transcript_31059:145-771(+)|eukprot:CAMPEP_0173381702 /NCGR_PEP_ID=MMETSP1356-20130122/4100_1 /TAXON_ID=77927 ORGANISM="Hemiselmis virescens, Strain PCC157" /NCGR_SAMPLE_ID=MMETSP1356 /ASSEMBLY_ACC=CAM_ASM_000847 /LENGTH=208 /DNA_ID=CAMNT_0014335647 /DNA_START=138 /DNA_END=764 /DNA_ORIENTATION=-